MADTDEVVQQILDSLRANDALKRRHANFWNFHDKRSKELGLFSEIFDKFEKDYEAKIVEWGLSPKDPPDVFAKLADGRLIGIEITELVNEAAIDAQICKPDRYSTELLRFDFSVAANKLRQKVEAKAKKLEHVHASYDELVLLIHTDEFMLKPEQFCSNEHGITPEIARIIDRVYLLFSYEADKQSCPLIQLM